MLFEINEYEALMIDEITGNGKTPESELPNEQNGHAIAANFSNLQEQEEILIMRSRPDSDGCSSAAREALMHRPGLGESDGCRFPKLRKRERARHGVWQGPYSLCGGEVL